MYDIAAVKNHCCCIECMLVLLRRMHVSVAVKNYAIVVKNVCYCCEERVLLLQRMYDIVAVKNHCCGTECTFLLL